MKAIHSSVGILPQVPIPADTLIEAIYKHVEQCARVCYKSEDKITDDSYKAMLDKLLKNHHWAMLEHGTVYLIIPGDFREIFEGLSKVVREGVLQSPYTTWWHMNNLHGTYEVTTNLRVILEAGLKGLGGRLDPSNLFPFLTDTLEELCPVVPQDTDHFEKRVTVKWIISRAIANEFVRHRVFSFAQESTRFCNYGNKEMEFIIPEWQSQPEFQYDPTAIWMLAMEEAEGKYYRLLKEGLAPQFARGVLPLDLKTELVMTGTISQWKQFLAMRVDGITGPAHPDAKAVASHLKDLLF